MNQPLIILYADTFVQLDNGNYYRIAHPRYIRRGDLILDRRFAKAGVCGAKLDDKKIVLLNLIHELFEVDVPLKYFYKLEYVYSPN